MSDQDQPSPLPWSPETNLMDFPGMIVDANGQPVCDVFEAADRNYIVHAVNSHAKMVEALEFYANLDNWRWMHAKTERLSEISFTSPDGCVMAAALEDIGDIARAALALAKEGK